MDKFFESVYALAHMSEERSKSYYIGYFQNSGGQFVTVPQNVNEEMNQLEDVEDMEKFLKKHFPDREIRVEKDRSIGWEKRFN